MSSSTKSVLYGIAAIATGCSAWFVVVAAIGYLFGGH
jgi:hypothetical protein